MGWKAGRDPLALARRYKDIGRKVSEGGKNSMDRLQADAHAEIDHRSWPAKSISKQDDPGGKKHFLDRNSPSKIKRTSGKTEALSIQVNAHWTPARTRAVQSIMRALGKGADLARKSLIVRGFRWRSPAKRIRLSANRPSLLGWANRPDKGTQALRHVVRVKDLRALALLILEPSMQVLRPLAKSEWEKILKEALR